MNTITPIIGIWLLLLSTAVAKADCVGCAGDIGIKLSAVSIWGTPSAPDDSTHTHHFGARCDAVNLAGYTGEVNIMITVEADLEGATKYVTADFISGSSTTAITSGNGFINAPSDGKFFKTDGVTSCGGEKNSLVVTINYDDFNTLLANGDGTMKVDVIAGSAVEDLCDICCESGHSWTPDTCCGLFIPCACPPNVESNSEVTLVYLDCDVVGGPFICGSDLDCDDTLFCTGTGTCIDGACVMTGNPCLASGKICNDTTDACDDCTKDTQCRDEDGLYCNGDETCSSGTCQASSNPCLSGEYCDEILDDCFPYPVCLP